MHFYPFYRNGSTSTCTPHAMHHCTSTSGPPTHVDPANVPVTFEDTVQTHCHNCHSTTPTDYYYFLLNDSTAAPTLRLNSLLLLTTPTPYAHVLLLTCSCSCPTTTTTITSLRLLQSVTSTHLLRFHSEVRRPTPSPTPAPSYS